jgi:hypothetical protein
MMQSCRSWLPLALTPSVIRRGLAYAVIVGAILIVINHGDALLRGEVSAGRACRMGLTVLVPYVVSTLSSVGAIRCAHEKNF